MGMNSKTNSKEGSPKVTLRKVKSCRGKRIGKQNCFLENTSRRGRSMSTILENKMEIEVAAPAPLKLELYDTRAFEHRSKTIFADLTELKKRNAQLKAQIAALNREEATRDLATASASMTPQSLSVSPSKRGSKLHFDK